MNEDLYLVGRFYDGELTGFISAGRPSTIRVYRSPESAKRGISSNKSFYSKTTEFKILKIGSLEEVTE